MARGKDLSSEQNISEVLAMLKQSVDTGGSEMGTIDEIAIANPDGISEEDLKQKLRIQYMASEAENETNGHDTYKIDEEFLQEAVNGSEAEVEEDAEEEFESEFEEEFEEEPKEEFEEEQLAEIDDAPLTVEDINAAEEEFGFLDPALLKLREEPVADGVTFIPMIHGESKIKIADDTLSDALVDDTWADGFEEKQDEDIDDDLTFDDLATNESDDDGVIYEPLALDEEDDDLTFDDLITDESDDDGVIYESLTLDAEEDDGLTFDQLSQSETIDENEVDILYTPISIEDNLSEDEVLDNIDLTEESAESFLGEYFAKDTSANLSVSETEIDIESIRARIETAEAEDEQNDDVPWYEDTVVPEAQTDADSADSSKVTPPEDFGEFNSGEEEFGSFGEGDELGAYYPAEEKPEYQVSSADISLLLQFGCDEEVLSIATDEDIESISNADALERISKSIPEGDGEEENGKAIDSKDALESKILSIYDDYSKTRGGVLIRLIVAAVLSFLLLLYDGLPLLGVQLPGIMDRNAYFMPHVLIGMQLLIICALTSGKKLWRGLRKLFTRASDAYSTVAVLLISVVIYDVVIMNVHIDRPPVFHFLAAIAVAMAIASECAELSATMSTYRFFFSDVLKRAGGEVISGSANDGAYYTLHKSAGKGSVAEKMYRGGLDHSQTVYSPLEIRSAAGYFNVADKKSKRSHTPMVIIVPSMVFAIIVGILAFVVSGDNGELWMSFGVALISLTFTLPILAIFSCWLPFALINRKAINAGYAFAGEYSAEQYAECNVFVFKDMHLLEKCSPRGVNLAIYDATSSEVLLGCLDSLYSIVGGPLAEIFSMGDEAKSLGECQIRRIAKSGVEAIIGTNYAVLVGNEQFMSRYGISFPQISFKNSGDEIFSLCVSINGRASARIVARYSVNEMFEMFAERLAENGIYCAVETFDPMLSAELLERIRGEGRPPVSVIHLGVDDLDEKNARKESALFDALGEDTGVLAKRSRLNLVVAAYDAVKTVSLRKKVNLYCYLTAVLGALLSLAGVFFGWASGINEFIILLYWIVTVGGLAALTVTGIPKDNRFSIESFKYDKERYVKAEKRTDKATDNNSKKNNKSLERK